MNSGKVVYVVGRDSSVEGMFREHGYTVLAGDLPHRDGIDLVCFTGGADWSPHLYGEENTHSWCNEARDNFEMEIYEHVKDLPKVGICRGGQLFTFMNGGKLIQHINGHGGANHTVFDKTTGQTIEVLTCHHQMMDPTEEMIGSCTAVIIAQDPRDGVNEVIWFPERRELAFQSHPEWGHDETTDYFFELIKRYNL